MRLTIRQLRNLIREELEIGRQTLLTEAAKGVNDLVGDMRIELREPYYSDDPAAVEVRLIEDSWAEPVAAVEITPSREGSCLGAMEVAMAYTNEKGWGPFLYDIAMELVGQRGLMSDRSSVSDEAFKVWAYYLKNRSDVETRSLDVTKDWADAKDITQLTPKDDSDDCKMRSVWKHLDKSNNDWQKNPLSFVYRTSGKSTINQLKSLNKITVKIKGINI